MRKGGEDLNGSGKEKGSSEESDQEEVGTCMALVTESTPGSRKDSRVS